MRTLYGAAIDSIAANAADVKDHEDILAAQADIAAQIDKLQQTVEEAYDNETLVENLSNIEATTKEIETAIAVWVEKALTEQTKLVANNEAYIRLTGELDSLQAKLDEAKETINTKYQEVADQFAEETANIQASITELRDSVTADYEAVKLTSESTIDSEPITEAIEKLLADAAEAYDKVTGIIGITINDIQSGAVEIYDVTGKKMNTLVKGGNLYIIKHANGKVYKLYVK